MSYRNKCWSVFLVMVLVGFLAIMGCSQGPISDEEAEEIRSQIKEMRDELSAVTRDLAEVTDAVESSDVEKQLEALREKLASMRSSLGDIDEELKPEEPARPAGQAPGGAPGGAAPGGQPSY